MKKMLLDENLPRPLVKHFSSKFQVETVSGLGWTSKKNGELIQAMVDQGLEYLLTADRNLEYQQNLDAYSIKFVVLFTFDNRYKTLAEHVTKIEETIEEMPKDQKLIHIDLRG